MSRRLLGPLKLDRTQFTPTSEMKPLLAKGEMATFDGRPFAAPTFALGTAPAGNLYSNVLDLGRFLSTVFAEGKGRTEPPFSKAKRSGRCSSPTREGWGQVEFRARLRTRRPGWTSPDRPWGAVYGFATEVGAAAGREAGRDRDCEP